MVDARPTIVVLSMLHPARCNGALLGIHIPRSNQHGDGPQEQSAGLPSPTSAPVAQLDSASVFGGNRSPFRKPSKTPVKRGAASSYGKSARLLKSPRIPANRRLQA